MEAKRQKVIDLLKLGVSAADIAAELGCSVKLARSYCATVYDLLKEQGYNFEQSDSVEFIEQYRWLARECAGEVEREDALRNELTNDCLAAAVKAWDTYRGESTRKTWLRNTFKNVCASYVANLGRKLVNGYSDTALDLIASAPTKTTPSESETKDAELGLVVGYVRPSYELGSGRDDESDTRDSGSDGAQYFESSAPKYFESSIVTEPVLRLSDDDKELDADIIGGLITANRDARDGEGWRVYRTPTQAELDDAAANGLPALTALNPARSIASCAANTYRPIVRTLGPRDVAWRAAPVVLFSTLRAWKSSNERASSELTARITRRRKRRSRSQVVVWPVRHYSDSDPLDILIDEEQLNEHEAKRAEREKRKAKPKPKQPRKRGRQQVYARSELAKMCGAWLASGIRKGAWSSRETGQQLASSSVMRILNNQFPGSERRLNDTDGTVLQAHLKRAGKLYGSDATFRAEADAWCELFEMHASWQPEKQSA